MYEKGYRVKEKGRKRKAYGKVKVKERINAKGKNKGIMVG
jgi:hypothetical protein